LIYVIGSGLSGIAATVALVRRGYHPTILDAGVQPDSEALALKARLASAEPEDWACEDVAQVRRMGPATQNGIPRKLSFGSDFAYRDVDPATSAQLRNSVILRSFAGGGFSNVWGGVIQDFPADEFQHWPLSQHQLSTHYSAIRALMQTPADEQLAPSTQSRALYEDLSKYRQELATRGIHFDYARLAVRTSDTPRHQNGCRRCGLCLYGCPYDSIFSAATVLSNLVREGRVTHVSGVIVDRVISSNGNIRIESRSVNRQDPRIFEGKAVFIAAGLLESARIVLNSTTTRIGTSPSLRIQQSDIFTLPLLRYRPTPDIDRERLHTLCQMVVNIDDPAISRHPVHLQLYGYNDKYPELLEKRLRAFGKPLRPVLRYVSARLLMVFGYLHSQVSSSVRLVRTADRGRLQVEGQPNPEGQRIGWAIARKLFQSRKYLRTVPVSRELRFDVPGGGLRSGGSFPMKRRPVGLETDPFGRVSGLPGIHIVDSSVLPSIPAGPLAFTVMANAHRIALECTIHDV